MTFSLHTLAAAVVLLAFAAPAAADGKRLATEQKFRELVADRELAGEQTLLRYISDGKMVGESRGKRAEGTWSWVGTSLCRTATLGSRNLGHDCLAIFVIGDLVIVVRDAGYGRAFALRFRSEGLRTGDSEEFACLRC